MILGSCLLSESPRSRRVSAIDNDRDVITVYSQRVQHGECGPVHPQNSSWCGSCTLIVRMMTQEPGNKQLVRAHTQTSAPYRNPHLLNSKRHGEVLSHFLDTLFLPRRLEDPAVPVFLSERHAPLGNSPVKPRVLCRSILGCSQLRP